MFPTRYKDKISSELAYPLNAKLVSESLADVPQAQDLGISFSSWRSTDRLRQSSEPYQVMSVSYSYRKRSQYDPRSLVGRYSQPIWEIEIQPVPSSLKHNVKELLINEAFPKVIAWLLTKQNITGIEEIHDLRILYDEGKDELRFKEHFHL